MTAVLPSTPSSRAHLPILAAVPVLLIVILTLDSAAMAVHFPYGIWMANVLTAAFFAWVYNLLSRRLRRQMLIGIGVAIV